MFSGIISGSYAVVALNKTNAGLNYKLRLPNPLLDGLLTGASVAVNGVCQTVVAIDMVNCTASFDAIPETLQRTNLKLLELGDKVNIERSVCIGDEIGGHIVSGHIVDNVPITNIDTANGSYIITIKCPQKWLKYILPKGFIALDGASLTVAEVRQQSGEFSVHLIPETLRLTCFSARKIGDRINLEIDSKTQAIVDTVERIMAEQANY